jgi:hypothetical protein
MVVACRVGFNAKKESRWFSVGAARLDASAGIERAGGDRPQFGKIQYDSPGTHTGSNAKLNAEYVTIKNTSTSTLSLTGYTVHDAAGHSYTFGTFHLRAGKTVYLHTGTGTDTWKHRYMNRGWYVWNNNGDIAHLHNALGTLRDACTRPGGAPDYKYC